MLSRLVIAFLPRSSRLLISWLQSPSAVILEPKKIKSDTVSTVSTVSPSISLEVMGPDGIRSWNHWEGIILSLCARCLVIFKSVTSWTVARQPGSSVYGIFQARILEWVAIFFSRGSS